MNDKDTQDDSSPTLSRREVIRWSTLAIAGYGATGHTRTFAQPKTLTRPAQRLLMGVCYYPELWPETDIAGDIERMQQLDINVVRMGEFIWSVVEARPGHYDFSLLKNVMDRMHQAGIQVVMCTPTATPPIWLIDGHPERCHHNQAGEVMSHGSRQHASYFHPAVRSACFDVIEQLAATLGEHPSLIGWQLDNELKAHVAEDFSPAAISAWHQWLADKFSTIEELNDAWGTRIWSQTYQAFDQIPAPVATPFMHSPALTTAYRLFCREAAADFLIAQSDILKRHSQAPITHNDNPAFNLHHERSMTAQDFASYDAYPSSEQWSSLVFRSDLYRAAIPDAQHWVMETSVAHNGWLGKHHTLHPEGFVPAEAVLTYGLGADAFCFWLWRQQRTGVEISHSAVISAWNEPTLGWKELETLNLYRQSLRPVLSQSQPSHATIAVTYSDQARAMLESEPPDAREGFPSRYRQIIEHWHHQILNAGYHRDIRFEGADIHDLKLLFTPCLPYVSEDFLKRIDAFVQGGGIWIAGPLTGMRGAEHSVPTNAGLGLLENYAGVKTDFIAPLTDTGAKGQALDMEVELSGWTAALTPLKGTRTVGTINSGRLQGYAFITEKSVGKGKVVLLSSSPHGPQANSFLQQLIRHYATDANIQSLPKATEGVVVCPRTYSDGRELYLVVNMGDTTGSLYLDKTGSDSLTGKRLPGSEIKLEPYQWQCIQFS